MRSSEIIKRLERKGWVIVNTRGSHCQYKHPEKKGRMNVPHPKSNLPVGTVRSIFKQAGWEWREK
jgi:predicted RNA binding protein YcfA (HicA-like mRNA interferase family)